jgi:hypothetical protein
VAVVHVFFEEQGFLKKTRGKLYDELVNIGKIFLLLYKCEI